MLDSTWPSVARGLAFTLCISLVACSSKSAKPGASSAGQSAEEPAAEDKPTKEEQIAAVIARIGEIQSALATLRGLPFKTPVEASYQSADDFRTYVKGQLAKELPPDKSASMSRAMYHLGLMTEAKDLAKVLEDAFVSQAGAYYDPATGKFFFLMLPENPLILDVLAAHELVHGLQDQHFDLSAFVEEGSEKKLDADALSARRFIVEGEATLLMIAYTVYSMTKTDPFQSEMRGVLRKQLATMAKMDLGSLVQQQKAQAGMLEELGPDFAKAIEAMDEIPPFVLIPMLEAYTRGTMPVFEALSAGGWKAVDALYANPPESTEQVLHPEKLVGTRDYPVVLALPSPDGLPGLRGWTEIDGDVFGELIWRAYFETWKIAGSGDATAGWDGDRYAVLTKGDRTIGLLASTWDSEQDAGEFVDAYVRSLAARFSGAAPDERGSVSVVARTDGTEVAIQRRGADVFIVDGAERGKGEALVGALAAGVKASRHPKDEGGAP